MILGARWLKTIGPHLADYDALNLKFLHKGNLAKLQGELDHFSTQAHLHHIRRLVHTKSIAEVYSMQLLEDQQHQIPLLDLPIDIELELALLLHIYSSVFNTPTSLPPPRTHDHSIPLI